MSAETGSTGTVVVLRGPVSVGSVIVAHAFTPHGIDNTGTEAL